MISQVFNDRSITNIMPDFLRFVVAWEFPASTHLLEVDESTEDGRFNRCA